MLTRPHASVETRSLTTIQDMGAFASGREFSAFLGLTPRQSSSGGKERLGRITKMGATAICASSWWSAPARRFAIARATTTRCAAGRAR